MAEAGAMRRLADRMRLGYGTETTPRLRGLKQGSFFTIFT